MLWSRKKAICCVVLLGFFSSQVAEAQIPTTGIANTIVKTLIGLWKHGQPLDFLDNKCQFDLSPTIHKFKFKWNGKFWCPGWAPFTGKGRASSRNGAIEEAVRDFAIRVVERQLATGEQVNDWLTNRYSG